MSNFIPGTVQHIELYLLYTVTAVILIKLEFSDASTLIGEYESYNNYELA